MKKRVIWHHLALGDLTEAYLYIGAESPAAAERLLDTVEDSVRFLLENPGAGRPREFRLPRARGIRSWVVKGSHTYLIFYRAAGEDLEVVRFVHGARDIPRLLEDET